MSLVNVVGANADIFTSTQVNDFAQLLHQYAELGTF